MRPMHLLLAAAAALIGSAATAADAPSKPAKRADGLVPFNEQETVLVDPKGKRVLLKAKVVFREGVLEMLVCPSRTKEHESILAVDSPAINVHAALLAVGAKAGRPVQFIREVKTPDGKVDFVEDYKPAAGQKIDIFLQWKDAKGKLHRVPAQKWVRHVVRRYYVVRMAELPDGVKLPKDSELKFHKKFSELAWFGHMTAKQRDELLELSDDEEFQDAIRKFHDRSQPRPMIAEWLFAGSGFRKDEVTGGKRYMAETGDLICVANFPTASVDVAVKSSSSGDSLLYEAWTERIPPLDTPVTVELIPVPGEFIDPLRPVRAPRP